MIAVKNYKFWFCTGSQDLYGDECLAHVAEHSRMIVENLNQSGILPYEVVWKPTLITNELIRKTFNEANSDEECAGVITWMHTFSPAKSWILGLQEFRKAYPGELSVSAEQRIIIGRSFAMQPDLLLMDEPYGQMDVKMRFYLEDEVIRLWKELGSTVVFITHNIEEAVYLAERVLILSNKPAKIKEEVRIDLPRPRDITSSQFIEYRNYITDKIKWW